MGGISPAGPLQFFVKAPNRSQALAYVNEMPGPRKYTRHADRVRDASRADENSWPSSFSWVCDRPLEDVIGAWKWLKPEWAGDHFSPPPPLLPAKLAFHAVASQMV